MNLIVEERMRQANFEVVWADRDMVLIRDIGPWDSHPTVTNDVENVVRRVAHFLRGRRLEYIDSNKNRDEIVVKDGKFAGFKAL